ncbi:MAG: hypothetical protein K2Y02_06535 [Burkholderiaceae bacterium]|nr:hypothetical protein [Burkholderiaceae bacterium]
MIIHLGAAGVPVSWTIIALYRDAYGVAGKAASVWHEGSSKDESHDSPQCIIELTGNDEAGWRFNRGDLWMSPRHLRRQSPDDGRWLVQHHTAPVPLSAPLAEAITAALRAKLVEFGYLIPRADWERRYPAQVMIGRRFGDFEAAHDAWRKANPDADVRMPFEPRWTPFMEAPKGYEFPFGMTETHVRTRGPDGAWERFDPPELVGIDDVGAKMRLLNSGWTPAEVAILLADEPVGE